MASLDPKQRQHVLTSFPVYLYVYTAQSTKYLAWITTRGDLNVPKTNYQLPSGCNSPHSSLDDTYCAFEPSVSDVYQELGTIGYCNAPIMVTITMAIHKLHTSVPRFANTLLTPKSLIAAWHPLFMTQLEGQRRTTVLYRTNSDHNHHLPTSARSDLSLNLTRTPPPVLFLFSSLLYQAPLLHPLHTI